MNIKNKVKYTVAYDKSTDTLSEKLNVLLNNIVNLIKTNHPSLKETSRITYGSEQMTSAPLYDGFYRLDSTSNHYESDLVFLGLDKNNIVISIGFYHGRLVIAMNADPYVESLYADIMERIRMNNSHYSTYYIVGKASRWIPNAGLNKYNTSIPYIISNNTIEMSVVYWSGSNSSGYMFYNGNRNTNLVDLVIYKTYDIANSLGCAIYRYSKNTSYNYNKPATILTFSLNENLSNNTVNDHVFSYCWYDGNKNYYTYHREEVVNPISANCKYDMREWFAIFDHFNHNDFSKYNNTNYTLEYKCTNMAELHTLGALDGIVTQYTELNVMPAVETVETSTNDYSSYNANFMSALCTAYNLPYLNNDNEIYLRQVRIPGFIKNCTGELYLMWTPAKESYKSGDIIEVDGDNYAIINKGVVCWAVKV